TLARLAHPRWQLDPYPEEVTLAMMQAIGELDLVRSHLLATSTYRSLSGSFSWADFEAVDQPRRARITYQTGERYRRLHDWLTAWHDCPEIELDVFLSRLFGEILSQPGYGFWRNDEAGSAAAALIDSVRKFRWEVGPALLEEGIPIAPEYVRMVEDGVISAQYLRRWQEAPGEAVEIAPAHTFLMENRPVEFQFWLDAGSRGWWERLNQPLTHPYVLSRAWTPGAVWTDLDEVEANQEGLFRLCLGLLRRCRQGVYLAYSELGMQGFEQRGPLLDAFQHLLRGEAWGGGRV
ncbi:MAG TPA: hypothetical protein VF813_05865, partial [Anaerolineaceae bacterium]